MSGTSLEDVAYRYSITRERIRQIFSKLEGLAWGKYKEEYTDFLNKRIYKKPKKEIYYSFCIVCSDKFVTKYRNNPKLYCDKHENFRQRDMSKKNKCQNCHKLFHPLSNVENKNQRSTGSFCSRKCYMKSPTFKNKIMGGRKRKLQ